MSNFKLATSECYEELVAICENINSPLDTRTIDLTSIYYIVGKKMVADKVISKYDNDLYTELFQALSELYLSVDNGVDGYNSIINNIGEILMPYNELVSCDILDVYYLYNNEFKLLIDYANKELQVDRLYEKIVPVSWISSKVLLVTVIST